MVQQDGDQLPQAINVGIKMTLKCNDNDEVFRHGEKVLRTACVQIKGGARWSRETDGCKGKPFSF